MRVDIQVLRGVAVLLVVIYHAGWGLFPHGYLGVDVFFVISGFLITGIVARDMDRKSFSFAGFYQRRIRRLLPAAYIVFFATTLLTVALLPRAQLNDYLFQLTGALTFTANITHWLDTGYFAGLANQKVLLHTWSLAIEEQFYLFLPLTLFLFTRRFRTLALTLAFVFSLLLCFYLALRRPEATFFWLPTRAWELLAGSLGALYIRGNSDTFANIDSWMRHFISASAIILIFLVSLIGIDPVHPRLDALLICLSTLALILLAPSWLNNGIIPQGLARLGDISYSLYLIHWPLLAFGRVVWLGDELPIQVSMAIVIASVLLSFCMYKFVEQRFRHASRTLLQDTRYAVFSGLLLVTVPALTSSVFFENDATNWEQFRRPNYGFSKICDYRNDFELRAECRNFPDSVDIFVWGDSFAMQWVPGLSEAQGLSIVQATKSSCGPNAYATPVITRRGMNWVEKCESFNDSVMQHLANLAEPTTVVLAARFNAFLNGTVRQNGEILETDRRLALNTFSSTIALLRNAGHKVVVIGPMPESRAQIGECLQRRASGLISVHRDLTDNCSLKSPAFLTYNQNIINFLNALSSHADVSVIRPDVYLCDSQICLTTVNDVPLYRDAIHLSYDGAKELSQQIEILKQISSGAR